LASHDFFREGEEKFIGEKIYCAMIINFSETEDQSIAGTGLVYPFCFGGISMKKIESV